MSGQAVMRAVLLEGNCQPHELEITSLSVPAPGAGQVRIRVAYCALNPLDTHARAGRIKWGVPSLPFVLGYEYSGKIDAVGAGVAEDLLGQRVCVYGQWGGCADFALAPATAIRPLPDGMPLALGACYFTGTVTAWHLIHTAGRVSPGQIVMIHSAAGAVGVLLTQIAKQAGATVVGLVGSASKASWAAPFGADYLVDTSEGPYDEKVREITAGKGVDLIVDGVQGPDALRNLRCLRPFGVVIFMGATGGLAPPLNVSQLIGGSLGVQGFVLDHALAVTGGSEMPGLHGALLSGQLRYPLEGRAPLADVGRLHGSFEARELVGRHVFEVGGEI